MAGSIQWKAVAETIRRRAVAGEVLEGAHLEPGPRVRHVAAGSAHHGRADIDGGHVERPAGQLPGELACAAADLQGSGAPGPITAVLTMVLTISPG
jgi:hypothetical protein